MGNKPTPAEIARNRYWVLHRLKSQINLPFYDSLETRCTLIFPQGKFDAVYALLLNAYWPDGRSNNMILHYQRVGFRLHLVYKVPLKSASTPSKRITRIIRLIDYVNVLGFEVEPSVSKVALHDLNAIRDYVEYIFWIRSNTLSVSSLLDSAEIQMAPGTDTIISLNKQYYPLETDPYTKKRIKPQDFYRMYGLPPSKEETASFHER